MVSISWIQFNFGLFFKFSILNLFKDNNQIGFIDDEYNYQLKESNDYLKNLTCLVNNTNGDGKYTIEVRFMCK